MFADNLQFSIKIYHGAFFGERFFMIRHDVIRVIRRESN